MYNVKLLLDKILLSYAHNRTFDICLHSFYFFEALWYEQNHSWEVSQYKDTVLDKMFLRPFYL